MFELKKNEENNSCDIKNEWELEYFKIALVYICLIMLLPIVILFTSNILIVRNLIKSRSNLKWNISLKTNDSKDDSKKRPNLKTNNINDNKDDINLIDKSNLKLKPYYLNMTQVINRVNKKANSTNRVTKILLLISFSYAFLNLPYFITW